tara:strand:+ start:454 stop:849 length:396 start_codon:yes stop_codon:yes gene_type:complete
MGASVSLNKISFQDMIYSINNNYTIITVIKTDDCLIKGTVNIYNEEKIINELWDKKLLSNPIIIYGTNSSDENVIVKYKQLHDLGFTHLYIYPGGLFEWLLLQDIYTDKNIKTTKKELNLMKYKPKNIINL